MNINKQIEIRAEIEQQCSSLTPSERRGFADSMILNYGLMEQLSKL